MTSGIKTTAGVPLQKMIKNRTDPVVQILTKLSTGTV